MPRRIPRWVWLAAPLAYFLYFYRLGATGLLGPDEPRYASIAREMARSGDWITPRLWGQPWFEKPALLYWLGAAGFRLGLGPEWAPRLAVAVVAVAFLVFYFRVLRREFGEPSACFATLMLGTCVGWVGFSQIAVPDLLLTAFFSAAMLLALPWIAKRDERLLPVAAALLGVAVLAKGLVPLVLALPLAMRGGIRSLLRPRVAAPFLAVALPWYLLCYLRNGGEFLKVFFWQQQFDRFTSGALMHLQPWWFYIPVLLGALLPWTPLAALAGGRREAWRDPRRRFLLAWVLFGLLFFSASANKLPGYILPLLPAAAALAALGLSEAGNARAWLAASALLLAMFPAAAQVLPAAVAEGLSRAPGLHGGPLWLVPAAVAGAAWILDARRRRFAAVLLIAGCVALGIVYLKRAAMPEVGRLASARGLWRQIDSRAGEVCVANLHRNLRYGLNYYSTVPLPDCTEQPKPLEIRQAPLQPPYLAPAPVVQQ